jgi:ubiquinone/menaquinone biosynthesis C-methylase UbiE/uncharacterized protein YbaR (Trm112 family)
MKSSTLDLLCCPGCKAALSLDGTAQEGNLLCTHCKRNFPIADGLPHFISPHDLEGLNQGVARFYERFSRLERIVEKLSFLGLGGERKARMEILHRLEISGGRILEVSIGSGSNLPYLFESPDRGEVFGLDISEVQLRRCGSLITKRGWPVDLFLGMAEALPFKSEAFDVVFHVGGINFFSDKKKAIEEMIRVARPGSKIVIADESERVAQVAARILRLSRSVEGRKVDTSVPIHMVPAEMEEIRKDGIWKRHGQYHGYCLEFRKPAS